MAVLIVILVIVVALVAYVAVTYNSLVQSRNRVKNSFAQVEAQIQRRFDLLPNLVDTVKSVASHEKILLDKVLASRADYMGSNAAKDKLAMNSQLNATLRSLFVVSEKYPELKGNASFANLQEELAETEDKITFARQFYNDAVTMYNNKLQMFPANLIAGMFGFKEEELFNMADETREAPELFDADELTDEERQRYPQKCPHCMATTNGTRYCSYCGSRVI